MPRLLADYAVPAGAGLVDLQVEMLELGAISVHGATVIELTQETFQRFFRCLGDTVPPDVSDELDHISKMRRTSPRAGHSAHGRLPIHPWALRRSRRRYANEEA